jgi:cell division protein FtsN
MRSHNKTPDRTRGAPTIPLTLRGMLGAPSRSGRRTARSFFVLPLVLALLALAAFPVFAVAGAIPEYETEENEIAIPHETVHKPKPKQHTESESHKKAHGSGVPTESTESSEGETEEPVEEVEEPTEETESKSHAGGGGGGHHDGGNKPGGEGGKAKGSEGGSSNKIGEKQKVAPPSSTPVANTSKDSGGGSSPLVPILIAVVVLAAISIGVVLYRQRSDGGSGGADRRVSPDAR